MASVLATLILAIMAPILMWRTHSVSKKFNEYKNYIETRNKVDSLLHEVPTGKISRDPSGGNLVGRINDYDFTYTIDADMQKTAERLLRKHDPFIGSIVVIDPTTGAVKVMASYSRRRAEYYEANPYSSMLDPISRNSVYPMASIQKLVTAAAAIEMGIAKPGDGFDCKGNLRIEEGKVIRCSRGHGAGHGRITVEHGLATSCNVVFALLSLEIKKDMLEEYYRKFMFNRRVDFDLPLAESSLMIQPGDYNLARAGSGLDGARVSPLHAALVAGAISNNGTMMRPYIVSKVSKNGREVIGIKPEKLVQSVKPETAKVVADMMDKTVQEGGTAFRKFGRAINGREAGLKVMAKTGSLNDNNPMQHFTWFVGHLDEGGNKLAFAIMMESDEAHTELHSVNLSRDFFLDVLRDKGGSGKKSR